MKPRKAKPSRPHVAKESRIASYQLEWTQLEVLLQRDRSSRVVEFGSRLTFMTALQEGFPELLIELARDVYQPFESQWRHDPPPERGPTVDGTPFRELLTRVEDRRFPADPVSALVSWIFSFGIRDLWLIDAAISTIRAWTFGDQQPEWHCDTPLLEVLPFAPKFGAWLPVAIDKNPALRPGTVSKERNRLF
jgi:hypothetical protein